jgi:hypothetical protein
MVGRRLQIAAAIVALLYIGAQCFQSWVFSRVAEGTTSVEQLLSGAHHLNVYRSSVMLIAIYALFFVYVVISLSYFERNKAASVFASLGFSVFLLLEISLRSVELFYTQIHLPAAYLATQDAGARQAILRSFDSFQQVQHSLYFPLMFSPMISSVILVLMIPAERWNWVVKSVFTINALRVALRISAEYLGWDVLGPRLRDNLYLPLTFVMFGGIAFWFFMKSREHEKSVKPDQVAKSRPA